MCLGTFCIVSQWYHKIQIFETGKAFLTTYFENNKDNVQQRQEVQDFQCMNSKIGQLIDDIATF